MCPIFNFQIVIVMFYNAKLMSLYYNNNIFAV